METNEFEKLCQEAKPISVSFDGDINIVFDNGIEVTVGKTTEWDCAVWEMETNIEKEQKMTEWQKRKDAENENKKQFEEERKRIMSKFTPEQWEEIESAFLYNNGMTYKQNKELQEQNQRFYSTMQQKYGQDFPLMVETLLTPPKERV
jgi:hypothetical protein